MTVSTETLLDRLYNLRGSDSDILKQMDLQKNKAEETKNRTTEEKSKLQSKIANLKKQHEELEEQGEKFKATLQGIHREEFNTVLTHLNIDFDPKNILDKLDRNLPKTIKTVEDDTKSAENELVKVEDEMNRAITTIDELGIRKDTALANQEKLNKDFELALSGKINITRDSITSLLSEFNFNEEEQREAAKILMFPEDALFAYDEKVKQKEKAGKSISEVIQEAKTMVDETEPSEENKEVLESDNDNKEALIHTLNDNHIDYLDFTGEEIDDLISHYNGFLFNKNMAYMKSKGFEPDVFVNHAKMIYDEELEKKVELLLNTGKEVLDIYLNPSVLVKYNYEQLEKSIYLLKENGMDPKDIPLMAY